MLKPLMRKRRRLFYFLLDISEKIGYYISRIHFKCDIGYKETFMKEKIYMRKKLLSMSNVLAEELEKYAHRKGMSQSETLRRILDEFFEKEKERIRVELKN